MLILYIIKTFIELLGQKVLFPSSILEFKSNHVPIGNYISLLDLDQNEKWEFLREFVDFLFKIKITLDNLF